MEKLREAMNTLDGVIPAPDNKMVDIDHLPIATAWQECRKALAAYDDMQSKHDTLMRRWEGMVETIRKKVDAGTLTMEDRQLLEALNLPHRYDRRLTALQDTMAQDSLKYQDIVPELNALCKTHPDCWHIPAMDCPYLDVCQRDDFKGEKNGCAEFEAAVLARYKELCKNPPLTLEELKHSHRKPVFIKYLRRELPGEWKVVRCVTDKAVKFTDKTSLYLPDSSPHVPCYGRAWLAYHSQPEACENRPLTRVELLKMDGEPVWIEYIPSPGEDSCGFWALVSVDEEDGEIHLLNSMGGSSSYDEARADIRAIYRHRPAGAKSVAG